MTLESIHQKLASGATPYLLSRKEAGVSEGPWGIDMYYEAAVLVDGSGDRISELTLPTRDKDARFIAATNGERPWSEGQWSDFLLLQRIYEILEAADIYPMHRKWCFEAMVQILQRLDDARRLGWREKGGGL